MSTTDRLAGPLLAGPLLAGPLLAGLLLAGPLLTPALAVSIAARAETIEVTLYRERDASDKVSGVAEPQSIRVVATGSRGGSAEVLAQGYGRATLELGSDPLWTLRALAEGYWSAPTTVTSSTQAVRLALRPAGRLIGTLAWPSGEKTPEELTVRLDPSAATTSEPGRPVESSCELSPETDRFICLVPAGQQDLRFRARGFVSIYLWERAVAAGQDLDLGSLRLEPGSSLVGFVETEDAGPFTSSTRVELVPQALGEVGIRATATLDRLAHETHPTARGFFHFPGVAPGSYRLRATQHGYAEALVEGVEVVHGYEARLRDPLVLTPPRELQVQVVPRTDSRGEPWRIELVLLRREKNARLAEAGADELGFASLEGLPAGSYLVLVYENRATRPFFHQSLELERRSTHTMIEVPIVEVEGELLLGDEPLAATLVFGGTFSPATAEMTADEEGRFRGFLAEEGEWAVEVSAEQPMIRRSLRKVEIARAPGKRKARLTLRLPDLRFSGRVIDEAGQAVPGALVWIRPEGETNDDFAFRADEEGAFELFGMDAGRVYLSAASRDQESDEISVDLVEDRESPPVELVLKRRLLLQGLVVSERGPVPGASVTLRTWGVLTHPATSTTTDARGNFEAQLPGGTREVHVQVKAPGHGLFLARRPVDEDRPLVLEVGSHWGAIELTFASDREQWIQIARSGGSTGLRSLLSWARLHVGEGWIESGHALIPRLAPGAYTLCFHEPGTADWLQLRALGQSPTGSHCANVDLQPFATRTVDLAAQEGR